MTDHQHIYEFVPAEPATWGPNGGDPEVLAHFKCACGYESYSGNPEAEEEANRGDWEYDIAKDRLLDEAGDMQ